MPNAIDRTVMPIPDPPRRRPYVLDAKAPRTVVCPIDALLPPTGAPNVLVVPLDDVGFGASTAFGRWCATPTPRRLAEGGLQFNRFHATALCARTKQALAQGGPLGGWVLYARRGELRYCHNVVGQQRFTVEGGAVPAGTQQARIAFAYDGGGGPGTGGTVMWYVEGDRVGEGRVEATVPLIFSFDETTDLGRDTASSASDEDTAEQSILTGRVSWVQIDVDEATEDVDHRISPEERPTDRDGAPVTARPSEP